MSFHDIRFPEDLSFGASGGPERRTEIVQLASGHEERNSPWSQSRRRFDAGTGMKGLDDIEIVIAFFEARRGRLHGFRWRDWSDWRSALPSKPISRRDQIIGRGDEITTIFQISKTYHSGPASETRIIKKPVKGTVIIAVDDVPMENDVDFTVNESTGEITFDKAPHAGELVTAGYEFDVPVRFDTDRLDISLDAFAAGQVISVPVVEILI